MGARPRDFDEKLVRESPTFKKWMKLPDGTKLRYACRDFIRGHGDDEERLMRRIMIARRNNLRDHEILKQARAQVEQLDTPTVKPVPSSSSTHHHYHHHSVDHGRENVQKQSISSTASISSANSESVGSHMTNEEDLEKGRALKRKLCALTHNMTDEELQKEMDAPAVEATRSYKSWLALPDEALFTYNQKYIKGREGHDWLLRKNIWRRMRYRRHNKVIVEKLKNEIVNDTATGSVLLSPSATMIHNVAAAVDCSIKSEDIDTAHAVAAAAAVSTNYDPSATINAALTATQIVDHTLLAAAAVSSSASDPNHMTHQHDNDDDNLHEAAVAAVAAAESYVKQARESDASELMSSYTQQQQQQHHHQQRAEEQAESSSSSTPPPPMSEHETIDIPSHHHHHASVHNPIIPEEDESNSGDLSHALEHHPHIHHQTPNPLVSFDGDALAGDALDVAAKLAAAACNVRDNDDEEEEEEEAETVEI